ncbi:MAG: energy transducer TonB [Candidatus Aminicenantes bacterium]
MWIFRNGHELAAKGICLLASFLFHAALVYLVFHWRMDYRIYPDKMDITELIIVPPEEIFIPEDINTHIKNLEGMELGEEFFLRRRFRRRTEITRDQTTVAGIKSGRTASEAGGGSITSKVTEGAPGSESVSGFNLDLPPEAESDLSSSFKLNLWAEPQEKEDMFTQIKRAAAGKDIDLWRYLYPHLSGAHRPTAVPSSKRSRGGVSARTEASSFLVEDYGIKPWAEAVVNRVQENWVIPPEEGEGIRGLVEISAEVKKNGDLAALNVVSSSNIQAFDEVALKALRLSSPFPALPDDFPLNTLEVYFEFHYHD